MGKRLAIEGQAALTNGGLRLTRKNQVIHLVEKDAQDTQAELLGLELFMPGSLMISGVERCIGERQRRPGPNAVVSQIQFAHVLAMKNFVQFSKRNLLGKHVSVPQASTKIFPAELNDDEPWSFQQDFLISLARSVGGEEPILLDGKRKLPCPACVAE